jgi:F-type H+-transporting ATPase subunit epsilon
MYDVEILTPEKRVLRESAIQVIAPGREGEFGVLTGHAPLFSILRDGVVRVDLAGGQKRFFSVKNAMLEVDSNRLVILADAAKEEKG